MALAGGRQKHSDRPFRQKSCLVGSSPGMGVVDENPVGHSVLTQDDNLYFSDINRHCPVREWHRQVDVHHLYRALVNQKIHRASIRGAEAQTVDDNLTLYLARYQDLVIKPE